MATTNLFDTDNGVIGTIDLRDDIFAIVVKPHLVQEVVRARGNALRRGTACTKTRSEVALSTKKLYRQKGTGHARRGSAGSPVLRKGGVAFGPKPRSYRQKVNRKVRRAALKMALADKFQSGALTVLQSFPMDQISTRVAAKTLRAITQGNSALVVIPDGSDNLALSLRNLPEITPARVDQLQVYDLLLKDRLIIIQPALDALEEALGR